MDWVGPEPIRPTPVPIHPDPPPMSRPAPTCTSVSADEHVAYGERMTAGRDNALQKPGQVCVGVLVCRRATTQVCACVPSTGHGWRRRKGTAQEEARGKRQEARGKPTHLHVWSRFCSFTLTAFANPFSPSGRRALHSPPSAILGN
jgi:hypothetical protein